MARRHDKTVLPGSDEIVSYLSVEKSDAYDSFKPGFYIVIAGIRETRAEALKQAARFKKWAPTA